MENFDRQEHWENIYRTRELKDVSWFQPVPFTSLDIIKRNKLPLHAKIIDIGGGDSFFVDHLLGLGYSNITVLDVSASALERAKLRLGDKASTITWIVADASTFEPSEKYDFWHDRAAFHFLTKESEIENYIHAVSQSLNPKGILVVGTFSEEGPTKCSGIEIKQYSEKTMTERLEKYFKLTDCKTVDHQTPSGSIQNFIFCSFSKL